MVLVVVVVVEVDVVVFLVVEGFIATLTLPLETQFLLHRSAKQQFQHWVELVVCPNVHIWNTNTLLLGVMVARAV